MSESKQGVSSPDPVEGAEETPPPTKGSPEAHPDAPDGVAGTQGDNKSQDDLDR